MTTQEQFRGQLKRALDAALADIELNTDDDPTVLAQRMASLARGIPQPLEEALGPFFDASTVSNFMEITRENLAEHVHGGSMLGMLTESGALVLPTFGFDGESVADWVGPVVGALLESGVDGWTVGLWLTEANTDLEGMTPLEWFRSGRDTETVLAQARLMSIHWAA